MLKGFTKRELERARTALRRVDVQAAVVLSVAALAVIVHAAFGSRRFFQETIGAQVTSTDLRGLLSWGWWFVVQGVAGFVVPVLILVVAFRRKIGEIGLGIGDWKFALSLGAAYLPLVVVGTWILSDQASFQANYPHFRPARHAWSLFLAYEVLFLFYWVGWEYLWRGFVLFGTAPAFGINAIFVQAMPFAILHMNKPLPEALLSVVGGVAIGALVWRCRSFWIAVPIHAAQMLALDFFCTLRARSGAEGIGFGALAEALRALSG